MTSGQPPRGITGRFSPKELELFARVHRVEIVARSTCRIARYAMIVATAWAVSWGAATIVRAVAGKTTGVALQLPTAADQSGIFGFAIDHWRGIFEILLGLTTLVSTKFALQLRARDKQNIAQLSPFRQLYEQLLDPKRTTSGLTRHGDTPREKDP
jgi:hypothetical protein